MVTKDSGIGISFLIVYVAAWLLNHAHQVSSDICGSGDSSTVTKGSGIGSSFLIVYVAWLLDYAYQVSVILCG